MGPPLAHFSALTRHCRAPREGQPRATSGLMHQSIDRLVGLSCETIEVLVIANFRYQLVWIAKVYEISIFQTF